MFQIFSGLYPFLKYITKIGISVFQKKNWQQFDISKTINSDSRVFRLCMVKYIVKIVLMIENGADVMNMAWYLNKSKQD